MSLVASLVLAAALAAALAAPVPPAVPPVVPPGPATAADSTPRTLRRADPDSVGMSAERLALIDQVMTRAVRAGGFPGAAVIVGRRGAIVWERGYGSLDWESGRRVDPAESIYDLASITKAVATATATMVLADRGRLDLDDPVGRWLPEYRRGDKARVTIRHLLTHRSGLPVGRELARKGRSAAEARRLVLATPLAAEPGTRTAYSDLGPDVLGFVVERVAGEPLDRFLQRTVYRRLGMRSTMFRPPGTARARIAPTEVAPPRGYPLRGEVHDENAHALGGVAGHAGLFSTAADLSIFAQMMLNGGVYAGARIVADSTVETFTRRTAGSRALGWDTCSGGGSCGLHLGPTAYGHAGYTGTSLWIDPTRDLFIIVLTNWVHPRDRRAAPVAILADARADVADVVALAVHDGAGLPALPDQLRTERAIGWWR